MSLLKNWCFSILEFTYAFGIGLLIGKKNHKKKNILRKFKKKECIFSIFPSLSMSFFDNMCLDGIIIVLVMCISCMKMEICEVVLEGITHETRAILESLNGGRCALQVDET